VPSVGATFQKGVFMKDQKCLLLLLVAAMAFALAACNDGANGEAEEGAYITISLGRDASRKAIPWDAAVDDGNILHDIYIDNNKVGTDVKIGDGVKTYSANPGSHTVSVCGYHPAGTLFSYGEKTVTVIAGQKAKCDITMLAAPSLSGTITISPPTGTVINQDLTADYSGSETVSFQWEKDGENIGTASTTKPNKYKPTEGGIYTVTVSATGYKPKTSDPVSVNDPSLSTLGGNISISPSGTVTAFTELTANYTGSESVSYHWEKDGSSVGTNSNKFTPTLAGSYIVIVRLTGYNEKASAAVTVIAPVGPIGSGTLSDPYIVYDVDTLSYVGKSPAGAYSDWGLDKYYKQMENIDLSSIANWTPIGTASARFTGNYDGNGHKISNLTITSATAAGVGLFAGTGSGATVKNVGIVNCNINVAFPTVGGVVGANQGTVQNCYATGDVTGTNYVGGVMGANQGTVEYCYSTGTVIGTSVVGGVVGGNTTGGTVQYCYSTGNVSGTSGAAGGVAGTNEGGTVQNCYSTGNVTGTIAGGVVGGSTSGASGTVKNCYATGNVTSSSIAGGVVGACSGGSTVENCVALNPNVSGGTDRQYVARVMGTNSSSGGGSIASGYGRKNMKVNGSSEGFDVGITFRNGADIEAGDWGSASWWQAKGFTTTDWDFSGVSATHLPKLKGMPEGLETQNPVIQ